MCAGVSRESPGNPESLRSLGVVPTLQGIFLGGSLLRVSRESPGPPGVSVESPGVPECPGSVSGGTPESPPSLRGVSGQKRTLPGVSERSSSLPGVFSAQGLRSSFILGKLLRSRLRPDECSEKSQLFPAAAGPRNGVDSLRNIMTRGGSVAFSGVLEPPESPTGFTNAAGTKDSRTRA